MQMDHKPGCVVLAAGGASRFGGNKLLATVEGQALIRRALSAVPAEKFSAVAVVTQYPETGSSSHWERAASPLKLRRYIHERKKSDF